MRLADCIHAVIIAVDQIDIPVPRCAEQDSVPRRRPRCAVASGITDHIGLRLDNSAAAGSLRGVADEPMPQEGWRNHLRRWFVKVPGEWPKASHRTPALYLHPPFPATCLSSPAPGPDHASGGPNSRRGCQLPASKRAAKINAPLHI